MRRFLLNREPVFTEKQIERLANIFDNAGQVVFGVMVLSPVISGVDKLNLGVLALGLLFVLAFWLISVLLSRKL